MRELRRIYNKKVSGDMIATGTPVHPPGLKPGDTVELEIEEIGVLSNPVVADN